jgi:hypothetical protein
MLGHFVQKKRTTGRSGRGQEFSEGNSSPEVQPETAPKIEEIPGRRAREWPIVVWPKSVRCLETTFPVSFLHTRACKANYLNNYS